MISDDLEIKWQQTWDGEGTKTQANAIGHDTAGNVLFGGTVLAKLVVDTPDVGPREISAGFVRKYTIDGALLWATTLPSPDESLGLIVTAVRAGEGDETVALGSLSADTPISAPNMTVTTLGADGNVQSQLVLDNPERAAYGSDMSLATGGDRIIAGTVYPQEIAPAHGSVLRLGAGGELRWQFSSTLLPVNSSLFHALSRPANGTFAVAGMQSLGAGNSRALVCVL
jgi:hypothetical protein